MQLPCWTLLVDYFLVWSERSPQSLCGYTVIFLTSCFDEIFVHFLFMSTWLSSQQCLGALLLVRRDLDLIVPAAPWEWHTDSIWLVRTMNQTMNDRVWFSVLIMYWWTAEGKLVQSWTELYIFCFGAKHSRHTVGQQLLYDLSAPGENKYFTHVFFLMIMEKGVEHGRTNWDTWCNLLVLWF